MSKITATRVAYFGKVPSRGDFIKSGENHRLLSTLDGWLDGTMERVSSDPHWKTTYDAAAPLHFAFLGSRRRLAVAGHVVNSRDQSGRRFPFLTASTLQVEQPLAFAARSPLALSRLWARMQSLTNELVSSTDCSALLGTYGDIEVEVETDARAYDAHMKDFLEIQTLGGLEGALRDSGHPVDLRNLLPALGLLLQPVMASGASRLDKGLALPLPDDPVYRYPVAALWLDLITPFLARAEFELSVFIHAVETKARMLLGFNGAPEITLHSALDPETGAQQNITLDDPDWVEAQTRSDYGLQKLANYLAQPDVTMRSARSIYRDVFLGD